MIRGRASSRSIGAPDGSRSATRARVDAEGVRPARAARERPRRRAPARRDPRAGLGRALVRTDEDARRPRRRGAQEARRPALDRDRARRRLPPRPRRRHDPPAAALVLDDHGVRPADPRGPARADLRAQRTGPAHGRRRTRRARARDARRGHARRAGRRTDMQQLADEYQADGRRPGRDRGPDGHERRRLRRRPRRGTSRHRPEFADVLATGDVASGYAPLGHARRSPCCTSRCRSRRRASCSARCASPSPRPSSTRGCGATGSPSPRSAASCSLAVAGVGFVLARSVTGPVRDLEHVADRLAAGDLARPRAGRRRDHPRCAPSPTASTTWPRASVSSSTPNARSSPTRRTSCGRRSPRCVCSSRTCSTRPRAEAGRAPRRCRDREVTRLARLVDGLLGLARAEGASPNASPSTSRPRRAIASTSGPRSPRSRASVSCSTLARRAARAPTVPGAVAQVLDNLLANALDAAPPDTARRPCRAGTTAWSSSTSSTTGRDDADEDGERAFDRFWRGPGAGPGGSGLGLAIVAQLATRVRRRRGAARGREHGVGTEARVRFVGRDA